MVSTGREADSVGLFNLLVLRCEVGISLALLLL
jgi:hypothetical protein